MQKFGIIAGCETWYGEVRRHAPLWLGLGVSGRHAERLWRFASPTVEPMSDLRRDALRALRGADLLPAVTADWLPTVAQRFADRLQAVALQPGSSAMRPEDVLGLAAETGLTGAKHYGRGRPTAHADGDLRTLHEQALWLIAGARTFATDHDGRGAALLFFSRREKLSEPEAWEVRFPMLTTGEVERVRSGGGPVEVADALVAGRAGLTADYVRKKRSAGGDSFGRR
jgi:hypothetical protein